MSWRDWTLTPAISLVSFALPAAAAWVFHKQVSAGLFADAIVFFGVLFGWTLVLQAALRAVFRLKPGIYSFATSPWVVYGWNVISFLSMTNLFLFYNGALLPPPLRKLFYQAMGANIGRGIVSVGGRICDPYLVTIEENCMIGDEALLLGHEVATGDDEDILILGQVRVRKGAIVGARSVVMPGVTIGENAMVKAMSMVPMNARVGANEVWAGVPARKVRGRSPEDEV